MKRTIRVMIFSLVLTAWFATGVFAQRMLIPVGRVVGLSLEEGSVTVAAYDETLGKLAREAGIHIGDEIISIDGMEIDSAGDLRRALEQSDGCVELVLERNGRRETLSLSPAATPSGPKLGVYLREGVTGIGTVTYYDPQEKTFGALGHGVNDSHGALYRMEQGYIYRATVVGVRPGKAGQPGQLKGSVTEETPAGLLTDNTSFGVFGEGVTFSGEALPVALPEEVEPGEAVIMSNISGSETELFTVELVKVYRGEEHKGRDMMIRVTDPRLLAHTGGIVAGMSGSPIIQDGKLVGAVTHVLVNQPDTGYGIFMENMLAAAG